MLFCIGINIQSCQISYISINKTIYAISQQDSSIIGSADALVSAATYIYKKQWDIAPET